MMHLSTGNMYQNIHNSYLYKFLRLFIYSL